MKASNVLFRTADHSRSRLSSATLSTHSPSSFTASAAVRAIRSPLTNRGPRSGQCRIWSNGCHLKKPVNLPGSEQEKQWNLPEVVEVVRERALEKAVESHRLRCCAVLGRSVEEVTKPKVAHMSKRKCKHANPDSLLEVWLRRSISLVKFGIQPSRIKKRIGEPQ